MYYVFQDKYGATHEVTLQEQNYAVNNRMRLNFLEGGFPFLTATVNVPEADLLPNEIIIKTYDENAGVLQFLLEEGIVEGPVKSINLNGEMCSIVKYKGFKSVDPEDLNKGLKVKLRGGDVAELVSWHHQLERGVIERSDGTPVSIDIRDIIEIIS